MAATLDHFTPTANLSANFEITADHASYEKIAMSNLLIDAGLDQQLTVRQLTASLYNGIIAASFTVAPGGQISSARALLSVPSAEPLAALLPSNLQPPVAVANAPLAATIIASGPANALATSFTLSLGDFNLTASPIVDLVNLKANGALTLHHPSAIAAFKNFGLAGSLAWPGAGSISLRANMLLSPTQSGLPDFVLSMGDLTAAGRILITPDNKVTGQITADTLALPPLANNLTPVWNVIGVTNGAIEMSANRVLFNGQKILGASTASIALHQNDATLTIQHAVLGNGNVTGTISATTAPATPPSLATALTLQAIDLSSIQLPLVFPITLPSGVADAQVNLTASGFAPTAWLATLNGTATMQAKSGTVAGFNLAGLSAALPLAGKTALRAACLAGTSSYDQLGMTATIDHGILKITSANLQGPAGSGSVSGTIDLPDQDLALNFSLLPKVRTPPVVGLSVVGPWAKPHRIPDLRAASRWQATN
ncbi:MAG: hypothetical protein B7Z71_01775 [Acidocella sp. 21-58-7]|nr:MAG: hypothetical protein B7Z71_01775 [Acidocella sp. 21-58-7]